MILLVIALVSEGTAEIAGDAAIPAAAGSSTEGHRVGRATTPVLIDGSLADDCWSDAPRIDRFRSLRGDRSDVPSTFAMVVCDAERLYIAVRCDEPAMPRLSTVAREHDGPTWQDDSVEIFLDPAGGRQAYAHLAINAVGVTRDAWVRAGTPEDLGWESHLTAAAARDDLGWTVEIAVPLSSLRMWETDEPWTFQIARTRPGARQHLTTLPSLATSYHAPRHFQPLHGIERSPLRVLEADAGEGLPGMNEARVAVRNQADREQTVVATLSIGGAVVAQRSERLAADGKAHLELPWVLAAGQVGRVSLAVEADGVTVAETDWPIRAAEVIGDPQRKTVLYAAGESVAIELPLSLSTRSRASAALRWVLRNESGVVDAGSITPVDDQLSIEFQPRASGRHELHLALEWPEGGTVEVRTPLILVEGPFGR